MRKYWRTLLLVLVLSSVLGWRFVHHSAHALGLPVVFTHPCDLAEAMREIGDEREIVVEAKPDHVLQINGHVFSVADAARELNEIFEHGRTPRIWFLADPSMSYGDVLTALGQANSKKPYERLVILLTRSQIERKEVLGAPPRLECPFPFLSR